MFFRVETPNFTNTDYEIGLSDRVRIRILKQLIRVCFFLKKNRVYDDAYNNAYNKVFVVDENNKRMKH